ncbi:MAG: peptide ABC transporter substrate-binding protein [Nocardioidaceae bacterium]
MASLGDRFRRPVLASGIALTGAALVLSACGGSGGAASGASTFTVGVPASIEHLMPGRSGSSNVDHAIWTPPTTVDPGSGEIVNAAAKSIQSEDQKTWTIKLREGWTFHNGDPVTAQSFADSWNATAYGPNAFENNANFATFEGYAELNPADGKPTAKTLSGVEVVDESTLRVTLSAPSSQFPYLLSNTTFAPIPEEALKDLDGFDKAPIGNGPYELAGDGLAPGVQQVTLERYDDYAGEAAETESVDVKFFQDTAAMYTAFQAGSIDVTFVADDDIAQAEQAYPDQFHEYSFPAVYYLGFPLWDERFEDPRVRQAFSLAIDREAIVDSLLRGSGEPANSIAPDLLEGGGGDECSYCEFDAEEARSLLADAGGWDGKLTLWTYREDAATTAVLEAISNQLRTNLGIEDVELNVEPSAELYPSIDGHKVDGPFLLYTGATYPHLYAMASVMFTPEGWANTPDYEGADAAGLLADAAGDEDALTDLTQEATASALHDAPVAPIYYPAAAVVWADHLSGVAPEFLGAPHIAGISVQ